MNRKKHLTYEQYTSLFKGKEKEALDRAWKNRDFEIEHYWKRASYFWTFIAVTFAGYVTLISSAYFNTTLKKEFPQIEFLIICLGLLFSVAWLLVNYGSKKWQRNWEAHIDTLENKITGPIYQTIYNSDSFSVTNINITVNYFVICVWLLIGFRYFDQNIYFRIGEGLEPDPYVWFCSIVTLGMIVNMLWFSGRTNYFYKDEGYSFFLRQSLYNNNAAEQKKT